jgi:AmmeMemoRadiSam system protein B
VAGAFYPADPDELIATVDRLVDAVPVPDDDRLAAAYIVPHAGYRYSGPTAAHVYARLRRHADAVRRVVLVGPAHRVPLRGCAATAADRWRTPLGNMPVDTAAIGALDRAGLTVVDEAPHAAEHSLEVQLPFLQRVLDRPVPIVPICAGQSPMDAVASVYEALSEPGTVLLCSTDFSHYLPDAQARHRDGRTARAVLDLAPERIGPGDACGRYALRGLLAWARQHGGEPTLLALDTSADTAGDASRVVGYPAFAIAPR